MAGDDLQRRGLTSDLARRFQLASFDELCLLDAALTAIEQARGLQWERRIPTGPGDIDRLFHVATPKPSRGVVDTECKGSWAFGDLVERQPNVPVAERCLECWRAVADHPIAVGLLAVVEDIVARDIERAELREAARREMLGEDLAIAVEPARPAEWHGDLTRASNVPAQLAGADPRDSYDELAIDESGGEGG